MSSILFMPARKYDFPDLPDALCTQVDPELFYPLPGESLEPARLICRRCDVQAECLKWALDHDERFGVWAGLSPQQRKKLKRGAV